MAPSATVGLSSELIHGLKAAGVSAMSRSLDGPSAAHHEPTLRQDIVDLQLGAFPPSAHDGG